MLSSGNHLRNRVVFKFFSGFWFSLHAKEYHLILAHLLDLLSGKDTPNAALDVFSSRCLFFLWSSIVDLTFFYFLFMLKGKLVLLELNLYLIVTESALASALVLLDEPNRADNLHVQCERVVNDFFDGLGPEVSARWSALMLVHISYELKFFFFHTHLFLGRLVVVSLLLLLFLGLLLFLFLSCVALNLLFECEFDFYVVLLSEITWHGDLYDGRIVLEVE